MANSNGKFNKASTNNKESVKRRSFFLMPIPLYVFLLFLLALCCLSYMVKSGKWRSNYISAADVPNALDDPCAKLIRQNDTGLIRPILLVESSTEEGLLVPTKIKIIEYIAQKKKEGVLNSASVYLNNLNTVNAITINPDELYDPASLMKVPMMLLYLSHARGHPDFLKTKIAYTKQLQGSVYATIKSKTITVGQTYTIDELLRYMIEYSDNEAFWLLAQNISNAEFVQLCKDFQIPERSEKKSDEAKEGNFVANVNSVSRFFRVLFNASYVGRTSSQYALGLLTQSDFKDGILKGVDPKLRVAHKFGERGDDRESQLHEFGIVYLPGNPYLLGVMTRGADKAKLAEVISDISKIAYDGMKGM